MALDATAATIIVLGLVVGLAGVLVPALRPWRTDLVLVGVLLLGAGAVFALVAGDEALELTDGPVLGWVVAHRSPGRTAVAETVSLVGGTAVTGVLAVVAAAVLALRGRPLRAVIWVVGVVLGALTIRLVKVVVERPRPPVATRLAVEPTASLPSGHSLMAALGLGLTVAAVVTLTRGTRSAGPVRAVVAVLAALAVLGIGASRAYLGVHWTSDVLAGWLLGAALALACVTAARALEARPAPPGDVAGNPGVVTRGGDGHVG